MAGSLATVLLLVAWLLVSVSGQCQSALIASRCYNDDARRCKRALNVLNQINLLSCHNKTRENNGYTGDDDRSHSLYIKNNKQTKMMWLEKT